MRNAILISKKSLRKLKHFVIYFLIIQNNTIVAIAATDLNIASKDIEVINNTTPLMSPIHADAPDGGNECRSADATRGCYILTPQDNNGDQCPAAGNPINLGSGNKFQKFVIELNSNINFDMFYNSYRTFNSGPQWAHYGKTIVGEGWSANNEIWMSGVYQSGGDTNPGCTYNCTYWEVGVRRPDGRVVWFTKPQSHNTLVGTWSRRYSRNTEKIRLIREANQWVLYNEDGLKEVFELVHLDPYSETFNHPERKQGAISKVFKHDGTYLKYSNASASQNHFLRRNVGHLVEDNIGDFKFEYFYASTDVIRLRKIVDTHDLSREWNFFYNSSNEILEKITYPDATETEFHYDKNNAKSDALLTGITDRRGIRYSTYTYEGHGLANTSELAGGVNKVTVNFSHTSGDDFTRTVTDSLNRVTTYQIEKRNNELFRVKDVIGPGCGTCTNGNSSYDYDSENNTVVKSVDGITTTYAINTTYEKQYGTYSSKTIAAGTPQEKTIYFTWDSNFHKKPKTITEPSVHNGSNKVTTFTYGANGKATEIKVEGFKPDGTAISRITTYQYNGPFGQISEINGPRIGNSDKTTFEYYPANFTTVYNRNRLKKITGPNNIVERNNIQWNANGDVISETRLNGVSLSNTYYPLTNRLATATISDGVKSLVTKYEYLATGQVEKVINNFGTAIESTLTMTYDGALRLTKITDTLGNYKEYVLDTEGNLKDEKVFDANNQLKKIISQTFDIYNLLDTRTSSGITVDYNYSESGKLIDIINGNGVITNYDYDELNRLILITQDSQGTDPSTADTDTSFEYDTHDNVKSVTDPRGNETKYFYDDLGNLIQLQSPDTGITTYEYDDAGNMTKKIDANGVTVNMTYDARGRLTFTDFKDSSQDTTIAYDQGINGMGRLSSFTDDTGTTTYNYEKMGNLNYKTQTMTGFNSTNYQSFNDLTVDYDYDAYNRLQKMTYPSGVEVLYEYNALNQVKKISSTIDGQSVVIADNVNYLPFGSIMGIDFGNGKNFNANFDDGYRLEDYSYGTDISASFQYDNNYNISTVTRENSRLTKAYFYDNLDRLEQENITAGIGSLVYEYDKLGNRIKSEDHGCTLPAPTTAKSNKADIPPLCSPAFSIDDYVIDSQSNQLLTINENDPRQYDLNGNLLLSSDTGNNKQWIYNDSNRLSQLNVEGVTRGEYFYNAIGQRVRKTQYKTDGNLAGEFLFVYDEAGQLIHISKYKNSQHIWDRETVWLNNRPVARIFTKYAGSSMLLQQIHYIQTDHLNTPRWITDDTGVRVWSWESDPFGRGLPEQDVDGDNIGYTFNMRFPGQYFDQESGNHYNYYRDYEPQTGRYLQSDPIGLEAGLNTYSYVDANPLNYSDFYGLSWFDDIERCLVSYGYRCKQKLPDPTPFILEAIGVGTARLPCDSYIECVFRCEVLLLAGELIQEGLLSPLKAYSKAYAEDYASKLIVGAGKVSGYLTAYGVVSCTWKCVKK